MHRIEINAQTGEQKIIPLSEAELEQRNQYIQNVLPAIHFKQLREERNQLLAETDHFALADSTLTDEMRAYRQASRDLPANTTDPANPVWPTKPEVSE